jgi:hypothetical protein
MGALDLGQDNRKMLRFSSQDSFMEIRDKLAEVLDRNAPRLQIRYRVEQNGSKKTSPTQVSEEDFDLFLDIIRPFFSIPRNGNGKKSKRPPPKGAIVVFLTDNTQASSNNKSGSGKGGKQVCASEFWLRRSMTDPSIGVAEAF